MLKPGPCTKYCLSIILLLKLAIDGYRPDLIANKFTKKLNIKVVSIQTYLRWTRLYILRPRVS